MDALTLRDKLSKRIVKLRLERKMTSEQLAIKIGLSKSGLRYIERGMKDPRVSTLEMIADGLRVPIVDLFNFEEGA